MIKKIVACGMLIIIVFSLAGCGNPYYRKNVIHTEYFKVFFDEKWDLAVVFELTDLGKEQEILVVPSHIDGWRVEKLGRQMGYGGNSKLESEKCKKLYLPYTLKYFNSGAVRGLLLDEMVINSAEYMNNSLSQIRSKKVVTLETYSDTLFTESDYYLKPNIYYHFNYEDSPNGGYYWIDNIAGENLYVNPETPMREGYEFAGWYLEPECENEWDDTFPSIEEELLLYADWKSID